ncbi:amidohydrolase [uncultured Fusobacterium sp.]|uniref:amidohydrolase n=1 Tax=uncultured Fusobacterium sp. TaxID=159267 RepID=UPI0027DC18BB|nr:amidohydrolase [uncultured Fusobacterium sp.]
MQIFKNARIHSFNSENTIYETMAIENGKIVSIGNTEDVLERFKEREDKEIIDLKGKTVIPGFNDSHVHFMNYGYTGKKIRLNECKSIEELIVLGKKTLPYGGWILGRGWNQDLFLGEKRIPEKRDLDKISKDVPVCYTRACGHVAVINSKAMELCGITPETECFGGDIDYDKGVFTENALYLVYSHISKLSLEEMKNIILETQEKFLAMGITSVQTDDFESFPDKDFKKVIQAYEELEREKKLKIRVYEQGLMPTKGRIKELAGHKYFTGTGDERFKMGPIKLLLDGSLGGKTALLQLPYEGEDNNRGVVTYTQEEFDEIVKYADSLEYQIAVHAIGDGAVKMALDSFEKLPALNRKRHGIVHCQITTMELIDRIKELDIIVYIQPIFLDYDLHIVEDRVGYKRSLESYIWKTMLNKGIKLCFGSDAPVDSADVIKAIHCAVNRQDMNFYPKDGWLPNERISVEEAVRCYTLNSAYASFEENKKGSLEIGKLADFIVLDRDIFTIDKSEILSTKIDSTVIGGEILYINI